MAFLKGIKKAVEIPVTVSLDLLDEQDNPVKIDIHPIVSYKRFKRTEARKVQIEVAKISKEASDAFEAGDIAALFGERLQYFDDLLSESIITWRKMPGAEDEDVPFSKEALAEAIEDSAYYEGLMAGLRKALGWGGTEEPAGSEAVESKNS